MRDIVIKYVKSSLSMSWKVYRGRGIAPSSINLHTGRRSVVTITPWPL